MSVDPFEGVKLWRRYRGDSLPPGARDEERGFAVAVPIPEARPQDAKAEILYFPRRRRVAVGEGRRRAEIGLLFDETPYGHLPYYFELDSVPVADSEPYETLRLYVDRDVQVRFPQGTQRQRGVRNAYRIDFPANLPALEPAHSLHVHVHRTQNRAAVPQSPLDAGAIFPPPLTHEGPTVSHSDTPRDAPIRKQVSRRAFCVQSITDAGGTRAYLGYTEEGAHTSLHGATTRWTRRRVVGVVTTSYFDPQHKSAYHLQVRSTARGLRVTVTLDRNSYARFGVVGADATVIDRILGRDQTERARSAFSDSGIDLRFARSPRRSMPRPGHPARDDGDSWHESDLLGSRIRLYPMRDEAAEAAFGIVDLGIGLIPVLGDIYDIGHLAYALVVGEELSGRPVDDADLLFMGLAVLPVIPGGLRQIRRFDQRHAAARRLVEGSDLGMDGLRRAIRAQRPLLDALVTRATDATEAFQMARAVVARGMVRDPSVAAAVREAGRRSGRRRPRHR